MEDETLYREMLAIALETEQGIRVAACAGDGEEALALARSLKPQVATLDIQLPGSMNGVELGFELRKLLPQVGIVLLSNHLDPAFTIPFRSKAFNGWSYLLKRSVTDVATLRRAVKGAACGQVVLDPKIVRGLAPRENSPLSMLTPRQQEILQLITQGYSNSAIAAELDLSIKSVENQINLIYQALQIDSTNRSVQPRVMAVLTYLRYCL